MTSQTARRPAVPLKTARSRSKSSSDTAFPAPHVIVVVLVPDAAQGTALLLLRTPTAPDGPYQRAVFAGRQRVIELQVQGRFTARPDGPLFFGAEITERMRLGLLTRTFSKVRSARVVHAYVGAWWFGERGVPRRGPLTPKRSVLNRQQHTFDEN